MNFFQKKETLLQSMTFMAIMAAINVIFVVMINFVNAFLFVLIFVLPLCCTLVILLCPKKYFLIYFFATIILSLIASLGNIYDVILFIVPSLITGAIFGIFVDKKVHYSISIISCAFVQLFLNYISFYFIDILADVDVYNLMGFFFEMFGEEYAAYIQHIFLFLISFSQELITYLVIKLGLKNLSFKSNDNYNTLVNIICLSINLVLTIICAFVYKEFMFVLLLSSFYFTFFLLIFLNKNSKLIYTILCVIFFVVAFFFVAIFYDFFDHPFGVLLTQFFPYLILIFSIIKYCLEKSSQK